MALTSDNKFLVSCGKENSIKVWSLENKNLSYAIENAHKNPLTKVIISKDNKFIVSAGADCWIKVWDINSGKCVISFENAHLDAITCMAISTNNQFLVTSSLDKSMKMIALPLPLPMKQFPFMDSSPTRISTESSPSNDKDAQFWKDKCKFLEGDIQSWKKKCEDAMAEIKKLTEQQQKSPTNQQQTSFQNQNLFQNPLMNQGIQNSLMGGLYQNNTTLTLEVKKMPNDASCLFHISACALEPKFYTPQEEDQKRVVKSVRKLVSHYLNKLPPYGVDQKELCGYRTPAEYADYIESDQIWGGTLEMCILGDHYGVQFCVFKLTDKGILASVYPPNHQYSKRIYLLNNSVKQESKKYDIIAAIINNVPTYILPPNDNNIYNGAVSLAEKIRQSSQ